MKVEVIRLSGAESPSEDNDTGNDTDNQPANDNRRVRYKKFFHDRFSLSIFILFWQIFYREII